MSKDPGPVTLDELAKTTLAAIRDIRMSRDDLITLVCKHSRVRNTRTGYGFRRLTRGEVKGTLEALRKVAGA